MIRSSTENAARLFCRPEPFRSLGYATNTSFGWQSRIRPRSHRTVAVAELWNFARQARKRRLRRPPASEQKGQIERFRNAVAVEISDAGLSGLARRAGFGAIASCHWLLPEDGGIGSPDARNKRLPIPCIGKGIPARRDRELDGQRRAGNMPSGGCAVAEPSHGAVASQKSPAAPRPDRYRNARRDEDVMGSSAASPSGGATPSGVRPCAYGHGGAGQDQSTGFMQPGCTIFTLLLCGPSIQISRSAGVAWHPRTSIVPFNAPPP